MSYCVRYFAETKVTLKDLSAAVKANASDYKIDGGDLMRGAEVLAEIEIDSAGSDLFIEDLNTRLAAVSAIGGPGPEWVGARLQSTHSIIAVRVDPNINWDLLAPLWAALASTSTGMTQVDGQGYYYDGNLVVAIA